MNRRGFLATLAAGLALDPERALWQPGRKRIFVPPPKQLILQPGDVITVRVSDEDLGLSLTFIRSFDPRFPGSTW